MCEHGGGITSGAGGKICDTAVEYDGENGISGGEKSEMAGVYGEEDGGEWGGGV